MKIARFFVALLFIFAVTASPALAADTIKVGAILAVTGPASFLGAPEAKTLQMLADEINSKGGINGKKIELIIKDSGANPEKAISFASCAAAEVIVNPVAKYVFKTPQKDSFAVKKIFMQMQKMGIKKVGVVVGNTGFGKAGKAQIEKIAPEYGIDIVISEVYDKKATDLTAVVTKVKSKDVQALINWSIVPAQSIVIKNMKQIGFNVPIFQSHGFGNIKYVKAAGSAANGVIFPAGRLLVADTLYKGHPQKNVLVKYMNDYESKFGEDASTFGGHAYDAFMILVEAVKKAGTDKEKVRDAIENMKGFVGTGGIFNFSPEDHNGLDIKAFEMLTVKDEKFTVLPN
jgi:branched-chain amino acid transport system substrate-binding protein